MVSEPWSPFAGVVLVLRLYVSHSLSQLPLSLLKTAQGHPMLVELKNGDTYNGRLTSCDTWMNINLRDVICTSRVSDVNGTLFTHSIKFRFLVP